jgi:hypothetical protein
LSERKCHRRRTAFRGPIAGQTSARQNHAADVAAGGFTGGNGKHGKHFDIISARFSAI